MLRSKALSLMALLALLAVVVAAPATSQSAEQKAGFRPCPDMAHWYTNNIKIQNVTCPKAKQVILRYTRSIVDNLQHDWSLTILGFKCDLTRKDYYGDSHRCKSGNRVVLFRRGIN